MHSTNNRLTTEIDKSDDAIWSTLLCEFDDASIYQTAAYNTIMYGRENISNIIVKEDNVVVAIAQIGIRRFPLLGTGTANIHWGPVWKKKGNNNDNQIFIKTIDALKTEYAHKRKLLLRIWPNEFNDTSGDIKEILLNNDFQHNINVRPYRTLRLRIDHSIETLRKNLDQKWRNQLNKAEKNNLTIEDGYTDDQYQVFLNLQKEMLHRKRYTPGVDYDEYRKIQAMLPDALKMKILICKLGNEPVSAAIYSAIGNTGIYMLGATGNKGMRANGSNLLQWYIIQWLRQNNFTFYDLGGIDPEINPGVYRFKCGIAGKLGEEVSHIGQFVYCKYWRAALLYKFMTKVKKMRRLFMSLLKNK